MNQSDKDAMERYIREMRAFSKRGSFPQAAKQEEKRQDAGEGVRQPSAEKQPAATGAEVAVESAAEEARQPSAEEQPAAATVAEVAAESAAEEARQLSAEEQPAADAGAEAAAKNTAGEAPGAEDGRGRADGATAFFRAQISACNQVIPIRGARVVLRRADEIEGFLLTDESGQTQMIETAAPPGENSLEPYNPNKELEYRADIFSEGYIPQLDLLVSQVGGELSLLNAELIPEPERTEE